MLSSAIVVSFGAGAASQLYLTANRPDGHLAHSVQAGGPPPAWTTPKFTSLPWTLPARSDDDGRQTGRLFWKKILYFHTRLG